MPWPSSILGLWIPAALVCIFSIFCFPSLYHSTLHSLRLGEQFPCSHRFTHLFNVWCSSPSSPNSNSETFSESGSASHTHSPRMDSGPTSSVHIQLTEPPPQPPPQLPIAGIPTGNNPDDSGQPPQLELGGTEITLDALGPMVVNVDGTFNRISNWDKMTEGEKKTTMRRITKRNKARLEALKAKEQKEAAKRRSQ